jgi:nucleoside-diphosphate-sugar epimerase
MDAASSDLRARIERPLRGTVVLTGASGFIGSRLRDALLAGGADVLSLTRADSPPATVGRSAPVDYAQPESLREVFAREQPEYVFHVAGATKGVSYDDFWRGNVQPTESLISALRRQPGRLRRFVLVSSQTAYGPSNDGPPVRESDPPRPIEHYGKSKLEAEQALQRCDDLPWTIVRPSVVYGPGDVDMFELFRAAKLGVNLFYGNREKRASIVYVDDLVQALVDAAQSERTLGRGYFVGDDVPYTWDEVQGHIARALGRRGVTLNLPARVVQVAARLGELATALDKKPRILNRQKALLDAQQAWLCSAQAAREDFGFAPRVAMADGTQRTYAWYRAHGWL